MTASDDEIQLESGRTEPRTNMFVLANMSSSSASGPVKVRNLSTYGALIEADSLPQMGEALELRRGPLVASGRVVRRFGNKAGVRLSGPIEVHIWLPLGHPRQQRDDGVSQIVKESRPADGYGASTMSISPEPDRIRQLALEIESLAVDLAVDSEVAARHAQDLQLLDIVAQVLRKLAEVR